MSWLVFAFSGPVLWALSTHFDKYLVERYFKESNVAVLLIFTALTGLVFLPVVWFFEPRVLALDPSPIALMTASGVIYMSALFLYLRALQHEEASIVVPFAQAAPLFGYVLGYLILGEVLTPRQILGGGLIIGGALLTGLRLGGPARFRVQTAALMVACALLMSLSSLTFKVFAISDDFWPTTFWMFAGQAVFGAVLLLVPDYRVGLAQMMRTNPGALIAINGVNELINLGGSLGTRYALLLAPLSIVQAVSGTTTIFVFLFGVLISAFLPSLGREDLSPRNLLQKGTSAALVALGVYLVNSGGIEP
ncbi:MAG TPA: DMT family transporter [Pseudorhodoplanes sp.]|jgi:drug/metabolite transporter (DMT)-like permease|nr:DMT family transporter [Pseudorhodoplanes sp.]